MDRGKVKTAVIVILLILDLILGVLLVWQTASARKVQRDALEHLHTILHNNGVELLPGELPSAEGVYALRSERSLTTEGALAKGLVGTDVSEDQGGNIYYYAGPGGEAWFRGSGDFEVVFSGSGSAEAVAAVLESYGIDPAADQWCQRVEGRSVFNCVTELTMTGGRITGLTGRLAAGSFAIETDAPAMDAATALVRFLAGLEENGFICTEISSVELGYTMSALVTGSFQLTPVWNVTTDTGEYYVNAITGAVERRAA